MDRPFSIDRFEGDDKSIAVLVADDGTTRDVPRADLPPHAKPGDVLTPDLKQIDAKATAEIALKARELHKELKANEPKGDITL